MSDDNKNQDQENPENEQTPSDNNEKPISIPTNLSQYFRGSKTDPPQNRPRGEQTDRNEDK